MNWRGNCIVSEAYVSSCSVITDSAGYIERDNGRDHRVATNKLNIKTRDNRDLGASHGYHGSLRDGLPDHRARLNQRLVPGALRPRR